MTQATKGDSAELLALFPQPEIVTQGDVKVYIPVLNFGQIAKIMKIAGPIFANAKDEKQWGELVAENGDHVGEILSVALSVPVDYVNAMPPDLVGNALLALFRINADFFKSRMLPLIAGFQSVAGAISAGQTP